MTAVAILTMTRLDLEHISQVFLKPRCPGLLLLDEAFAPLDPASKA
jgi:hypothetical protein